MNKIVLDDLQRKYSIPLEAVSKAAEAMEGLFDAINACYFPPAMIADMVMLEHRTLQQNLAKVIIAILLKWAECSRSGNYDMRNEATVKMAVAVEKTVKGVYLPFV